MNNQAFSLLPLKAVDPLYGFQYKPLGHLYTFKLSKLLATFGATEQDVQAGIAYCNVNPGLGILDGPFKGRIIQDIAPDAQEAIREAYRKKVEIAREKALQDLLNQNQALTPVAPYVVPLPPYYLHVGERAMHRLSEYDKE